MGEKTSAPVAPTGGREWTHGFWSCCSPFSTCMMSCCCACMVHGKTESRLKNPAAAEHSSMNGSCCAWACLAYIGCSCILTAMQRTKLRDTYGIEGSSVGDFCAAFWCPCCTVMQSSKESVTRTQQVGAYQSPPGMTYP
ncbi:hypothetical protein AJ79_05722 [Helicocarpus griseus UAMH5409]|uniref:PLAC8 family protein n=1 Tax=Helicocarpus griseus UAMH5409 TaxID=1447875 RepID=A0A2B7XK77_9EURO|nr:hypothetical protein AJ79_05722 [Helicocarpus griseus UAMH5409]